METAEKMTESLWGRTCQEHLSPVVLNGTEQADLVIIGGGFSGCAAALEAARRGAKVCLLEAHEIGHGGSGRNVGLVNAGLWLSPNEIEKALGAEVGNRLSTQLAKAPAHVFSLIKDHTITCEAVRNGTLNCAHSAAGLTSLEDRQAQLLKLGTLVQVLDADETARRTGSNSFHGALFDPGAGTIQPLSYVRGLARAAVESGAHIFENSPVHVVSHEAGCWRVETETGQVTAPALLLATNAYHEDFKGLAANDYITCNFFQMATRPLGDRLRDTILPGNEGCWDTAMVMTSFRKDQAGRLIIGGVGDLTHPASSLHAQWAARKLAALFPDLKNEPLEMHWQGRIAMTSDHTPKILEIGPSAYSVHGYSGRGIGPGTIFGTRLAEALLTGDAAGLPIPPVKAYREPFSDLKAGFYESGATLVHMISERV